MIENFWHLLRKKIFQSSDNARRSCTYWHRYFLKGFLLFNRPQEILWSILVWYFRQLLIRNRIESIQFGSKKAINRYHFCCSSRVWGCDNIHNPILSDFSRIDLNQFCSIVLLLSMEIYVDLHFEFQYWEMTFRWS